MEIAQTRQGTKLSNSKDMLNYETWQVERGFWRAPLQSPLHQRLSEPTDNT